MVVSQPTHSTTRWYLPTLEVRVESTDTHLQHELEDCLRGWFFKEPIGDALVPRLSIYAQCSSSAPRLPSEPPFADLGRGVRAWDRSSGEGARHVLVSDGKLSAEIQVVGDGLTALFCAPSVVDETNADNFCGFVEVLLCLLLPRLGYIPLPACEATGWGGDTSKDPRSLIVLGRPAARRDVVSKLYRDGWRATSRTQVFLTRDESGNVVVLGGELSPSHYRPRKIVRLLPESDSSSSKISPAWMRSADLSARLLGSPRSNAVRLDELLETTGGVTDVNWNEDGRSVSSSLEKILKRRGKADTSTARPGQRFRGFRHSH